MYMNINGAGLLVQLLALSGLLAFGFRVLRQRRQRAVLIRIRRADHHSTRLPRHE